MSKLKVAALQGLSASSDAITLANDGTCTANITNNLSNRNVIKNSAMQIAQRGTSFTSVTSSAYHLDRFYLYLQNTSAAFTATQSTDSPDGFANSYKLDVTTADTSIASNEEIRLIHKLEGFDVQRFMKGSSAAKRFTLSFYVKTNKTGVYCVKLYDRDNNRDVSGSYTVSDTNWNRYTIDFPADTTGAFDNDNASSLEITWWLAAGSAALGGTLNTAWRSNADAGSATGQVNFADSTSNDWYLTGVQLEATDTGVATDFEHRSFGQELALCQRYYQVLVEGSSKSICLALSFTGNNGFGFIDLKTEMRAAPTLDVVTGTAYWRAFRNGGTGDFNDVIMENNSNKIVGLKFQGVTSGTSLASQEVGFMRSNNSAAFLAASSEL